MQSTLAFNTNLSRTKEVKSFQHLLEHDRARGQKLLAARAPIGPMGIQELRKKNHGQSHGSAPSTTGETVDVTDAAVTYTMSVGVGNPPTPYNLLIDTGSSNTWVGADKQYKQTSTSRTTRHTVNVSYGSGHFSGTEYTDTVTLSKNLVIQNQSIGVSSKAEGFNGVDGILGIGPADLTQGTVSREGVVPTVTDSLYQEKLISTESIGIFYQPTTENNLANGELTFGGVDQAKIRGDMTYVPITSVSPASKYWGIDQDIQYNRQTILSGAGIVDTGTTLLLIATSSFESYQKMTGAKMDSRTGLLVFTEEQFSNLQPLNFVIGGRTFSMTPNAQIWPRHLNTMLGGEPGKIYSIVADLGSPNGSGLDFINGFGFLQRFYSVYDTT
ncbi:acid protease, partial [Dendrothele bispora CBS 962.96]